MGVDLALQVTSPGLIPGMHMIFQVVPGVIPKFRARSNPWASLVWSKRKKKKKEKEKRNLVCYSIKISIRARDIVQQ